MPKVSIITPWHNCPELIPAYRDAVSKADEVIIIDNASDDETANALKSLGVYIRNDENLRYSKANNQGLEIAAGDIVVFLNSDVQGDPAWIDIVKNFAQRNYLFGPSLGRAWIDEQHIVYIEGWCIGGFTDEIRAFGGWNDKDFPGMYWEDNEFCWRATTHGLSLRQIDLPLHHLSNYTSKRTPGSYDKTGENRNVFYEIVRKTRQA